MGDDNHIHTLGDYSKPSHEGHRNTVELSVGNNGYLFDLTPSGWCKMDAYSPDFIPRIQTNTSRISLNLTAKLRNDILMFQQHHGEYLSEAWTHFKDLLQKVPHHGIDRWLKIQFFYDHVSFHLKCEIDRVVGGKLRNKNIDKSWEIIENLALYGHEGWDKTKEFVKLNVNSISLTKGEEERSDKKEVTPDNIERPTKTEAEMPVKKAETKNEAKNRAGNKSIKTPENEEALDAHGSQPIAYYLKHKINEKLIEGLADNKRFNNSLSRTRVGKKKRKTYKVLPRGCVYNAILKKKITKKEDIRENFEIPCSIGGLKHVNALIDQGSDVNVMPYSAYMKLTDERHAETDIRLSLASHSYIYPLGITEDVLVEASPEMGRKDKASPGKGDKVQPMKEQKF
ncbi:hypothetical protein Tco_0723630 [Tanacetum coccineum]